MMTMTTATTPGAAAQLRDDGGARDFFEGYAADFDHIYEETGKGPLAKFVDTRLRREIRVRFEKTFEALQPIKGRSLLDAGCGGGRYVIPAAKAGASRVLGLDFSEAMLELGRTKAAAEGVADVCRFENGDLLTYPLKNKSFDYSIAIGFFDYQHDPARVLRVLARATRRRLCASIPKRWHVLTPQRWLRYRLFRCFVRFYSRPELERLAAELKPRKTTILDIGREYHLTLDFS